MEADRGVHSLVKMAWLYTWLGFTRGKYTWEVRMREMTFTANNNYHHENVKSNSG